MNGYLTSALKNFGVSFETSNSFTLQNGADLLKKQFVIVEKSIYPDSLEVIDTNDLIEYLGSIASFTTQSSFNRQQAFDYFEQKKDDKGILHIPKEYGLFCCSTEVSKESYLRLQMHAI